MISQKKCLHCHLVLGSTQQEFCCYGCQIAYNLINSLDLNSYYDFCKNIYNYRPMKVEEIHNEVNMKVEEIHNEVNYVDFVIYNKAKDQYEINLLVGGVQCGSCIWLIENALERQEGLVSSKINLSTERLLLAWKGGVEDIGKYVEVVQKLGYKLIPFDPKLVEDENSAKEVFLLKCIAVSGFATVQLMMIVMGIWFADTEYDIGSNTKNLLNLIAVIIAIPSILYSGLPFYRSAYGALKNKRSNMDVPITIGIVATTIISIWEYIRGGMYTYFDSAIMLIFALLVGKFLDIKCRNQAKSKVKELILRQARTVTLISDGKLRLLPINKVSVGDIIYVSVGEKIPIDGVIIEGSTELDNSIITGETLPIMAQKGQEVFAGSINIQAPIKVQIKKLGDDTVLGEIIKLIESAEQAKAKYVVIADKVASLYTPVVLILALLTFFIWMGMGAKVHDAVLYAVSVLIITCPCALGLAVPVAQIIASSSLMKRGVLLKSSSALERISQIDTVVFDKTGTLTYGILEFVNQEEIGPEDMQMIASLAALSRHPLCKAISSKYSGEILPLVVTEKNGMGLEAIIDDKLYRLGNKIWCGVKQEDDIVTAGTYSEVWFKSDKQPPIRLKFSDTIRLDARAVVRELQDQGYKTWILSGDRKQAVAYIASSLGIADYHAEYTPEDKYNFLEQLASMGRLTLMVGDGLNDAPALKKAHASISPSSAMDIAQNSADVIFQNNLTATMGIIDIAKRCNSIVKQNFAMSLIYNIMSIPIAACGLVTPFLAAIAMALSSICVILNSLRLYIHRAKY